jgi:hypothetical protein
MKLALLSIARYSAALAAIGGGTVTTGCLRFGVEGTGMSSSSAIRPAIASSRQPAHLFVRFSWLWQ